MLPLRYEAIQDLEIDYACTTARAIVSAKIISYVTSMGPEDQARNAEVMSRLIAKLAQDTPIKGKPRPTQCNYCRQSDPNLTLKCGNCNNYFPST